MSGVEVVGIVLEGIAITLSIVSSLHETLDNCAQNVPTCTSIQTSLATIANVLTTHRHNPCLNTDLWTFILRQLRSDFDPHEGQLTLQVQRLHSQASQWYSKFFLANSIARQLDAIRNRIQTSIPALIGLDNRATTEQAELARIHANILNYASEVSPAQIGFPMLDVRHSDGGVFQVPYSPMETVLQFKKTVGNLISMDVSSFYLVAGGGRLRDYYCLWEYGIRAGVTVHLVICVRTLGDDATGM